MAESQTGLNNTRMNQLSKFAELLPEVLGPVRDLTHEAYRDAQLKGAPKNTRMPSPCSSHTVPR